MAGDAEGTRGEGRAHSRAGPRAGSALSLGSRAHSRTRDAPGAVRTGPRQMEDEVQGTWGKRPPRGGSAGWDPDAGVRSATDQRWDPRALTGPQAHALRCPVPARPPGVGVCVSTALTQWGPRVCPEWTATWGHSGTRCTGWMLQGCGPLGGSQTSTRVDTRGHTQSLSSPGAPPAVSPHLHPPAPSQTTGDLFK